jgi:hypothetical protein
LRLQKQLFYEKIYSFPPFFPSSLRRGNTGGPVLLHGREESERQHQ